MAKDPAFLFYYQDFMVGTRNFTLEQKGAYIDCLCEQADNGYIKLKHMKDICGNNGVLRVVKEKFSCQKRGRYINEKLQSVMEKRKKYAESRRKNRLGAKSYD